jgi:pyroglutamyl-peptidase
MTARRTGRAHVLLTGFGPFPGVPVNATMRLVPMLAEAAPRAFPGVEFSTLLLATEWETAPARARHVLQETRPDLVLHFGVSGRARGFEIETRARNDCQLSADAAGFYPAGPRLAPEADAVLRATLPVHHIVGRLRALRIPAYASRDAGAYLCNALLWRSLEADREAARATRIGFVHIPASLGAGAAPLRGRSSGACPLTWEQARTGGLEIIAAGLGQARVRS